MTTTRHGGKQRTRVDWGAARAAYVALGPTERTYARIAREFRVSETTVRKWARRDDWPAAADKADEQAAAAAERAAVRSIEARNLSTIKLVEALRAKAADQLGDVDANVVVRALPRYLHLEQLIAGEATDRIAIADAQAIVDALLGLMSRYVPGDRWEAFVADVRTVVAGMPGGPSEAAA